MPPSLFLLLPSTNSCGHFIESVISPISSLHTYDQCRQPGVRGKRASETPHFLESRPKQVCWLLARGAAGWPAEATWKRLSLSCGVCVTVCLAGNAMLGEKNCRCVVLGTKQR